MKEDDVVVGAFMYLRSQNDVVRRMATDAETMEEKDYVKTHVDFIARRIKLPPEVAEQVCTKLWEYYNEQIEDGEEDPEVHAVYLQLRDQDGVVDKMETSASRMELGIYIDTYTGFVIERTGLSRIQAQQVCTKLLHYYSPFF